jgi:hypothetical protein
MINLLFLPIKRKTHLQKAHEFLCNLKLTKLADKLTETSYSQIGVTKTLVKRLNQSEKASQLARKIFNLTKQNLIKSYL